VIEKDLGFQIKGSLVTSVHEERHRGMLMGNLPRRADLLETQRLTKPQVNPFAVRLGARHVGKAVRLGDNVSHHNFQIFVLAADPAPPGGKPLFELVPILYRNEGRGEAVHHRSGQAARGDAFRVLGA
jgi:hypothetical protein